MKSLESKRKRREIPLDFKPDTEHLEKIYSSRNRKDKRADSEINIDDYIKEVFGNNAPIFSEQEAGKATINSELADKMAFEDLQKKILEDIQKLQERAQSLRDL